MGSEVCWVEEPVAPRVRLSCIPSQLGLGAKLSSQLPWKVFQGFQELQESKILPSLAWCCPSVALGAVPVLVVHTANTFPLQEDTGCAPEALLL